MNDKEKEILDNEEQGFFFEDKRNFIKFLKSYFTRSPDVPGTKSSTLNIN